MQMGMSGLISINKRYKASALDTNELLGLRRILHIRLRPQNREVISETSN